MTKARWKDQERAMQRAFARATSEMLADDDGRPLAEVAIGRRLVIEAPHTFNQYVARARSAGFTWEQIAEGVPGYTRDHGAEAAQMLFTQVAGSPRPALADHYVSWRCGDCEGIVLDRGPYGGHPTDAEPGHREGCERLSRDITAYLTRLQADNEVKLAVDQHVDDAIHGRRTPALRIQVMGPGSES